MTRPSYQGTTKNGIFFVVTVLLSIFTILSLWQGTFWWLLYLLLDIFCIAIYLKSRKDPNKAAGVL